MVQLQGDQEDLWHPPFFFSITTVEGGKEGGREGEERRKMKNCSNCSPILPGQFNAAFNLKSHAQRETPNTGWKS